MTERMVCFKWLKSVEKVYFKWLKSAEMRPLSHTLSRTVMKSVAKLSEEHCQKEKRNHYSDKEKVKDKLQTNIC